MKLKISRCLPAITILCLSLWASPGWTKMKIGVFDMQKAVRTVKDGKNASATLKKELELKTKQLQKKEAKIKKEIENFKKRSLVMDPKARQKKEEEIRMKVMALQQEGQGLQNELQKKELTLLNPILEKLRKITKQFSKKNGFSIVINNVQNSVVYFEKTYDITNKVIKMYDKKFK